MTNDISHDTLSETAIDPAATVRETMTRLPQTKDVFSRFGVDTCCGSGVPIVDAAHRDGADLEGLLAALRQVTAGA
jgi:iron-sulfur cluster repair protein YtfE (RIC family)